MNDSFRYVSFKLPKDSEYEKFIEKIANEKDLTWRSAIKLLLFEYIDLRLGKFDNAINKHDSFIQKNKVIEKKSEVTFIEETPQINPEDVKASSEVLF